MRCTLIHTLICTLALVEASYAVKPMEIDTCKPNPYLFSSSIHIGHLLPTWDFVRSKYATDGRDFGKFKDLSFLVMKQTYGEKPIEQIFNYPRYGVGLYTGQYFKDNYLTHPLGLYGIFMGTIAEIGRLRLDYGLLSGIAGNWNHYNPAQGNYNTTLADDYTTHIDFSLNLNYEINPHLETGIGMSFGHFSNGAMEIPNFGLNMLSPRISLTYLPENLRPKRIKRSIPPYWKNTYLDVALVGGEKNLPYPECDLDTAHNFYGFHYPQFALTAVLNRRIGYVVALGLGFHLGYDSSKNTRYRFHGTRVTPDLSFLADNFNLGIVPSAEFNFDRIAFVLQPCYTLLKHETTFKKPDFFGKFGLKFVLWDNVYSGIQLHTFKLHADFIEFSIGYRLPLGTTHQSS